MSFKDVLFLALVATFQKSGTVWAILVPYGKHLGKFILKLGMECRRCDLIIFYF